MGNVRPAIGEKISSTFPLTTCIEGKSDAQRGVVRERRRSLHRATSIGREQRRVHEGQRLRLSVRATLKPAPSDVRAPAFPPAARFVSRPAITYRSVPAHGGMLQGGRILANFLNKTEACPYRRGAGRQFVDLCAKSEHDQWSACLTVFGSRRFS